MYVGALLLCLAALCPTAVQSAAVRRKRNNIGGPWQLNSFSQGFAAPSQGGGGSNAAMDTLSGVLKQFIGPQQAPETAQAIDSVTSQRLQQNSVQPIPDDFDFARFQQQQQQQVDLRGIASGNVAGIAPIPVPGFPGPSDVPAIPGVNTIPGLDMWNYLIGQLIPQAVPATNQLLSGSVSRLLPQNTTKNLAKDVFKSISPPATTVEVARMMGRWFQVITSPHVIREACTVAHFGALTNNTYSATFTVLKFYREGNPNGPPRFALGYGFQSGDDGQFVLHNSNSPDSEPFWVIKTGPLNQFNQYDYAIVSNWVKFPVFVIARDPQRFQEYYMQEVLQYLEDRQYINVLTKALNMIAPVDYSQCQYTPTFSSAG